MRSGVSFLRMATTTERIVASIVIIGVLDIAALAGAIYRGIRSSRTPADPPDTVREVSVLVLGFRGSGKTLMLASMFKQLRLGGRDGVTLTTDEASERELEQLITKIRDTSGNELPDATSLGDTREWRFSVRVSAEQAKTATALNLKYIDYAGENAENYIGAGSHEIDRAFLETLKSSDILLGMLDGEKIRQLLMEPNPSATDSPHAHEIERLLRLIVRTDQKSVHLVISKWDRLVDVRGRRLSLEEVVDRVERKVPGLRDFRSNPRFHTIRVIPVSTLGEGFIEVSNNGAWVKRKGATWRPENVELPLYRALPDILAGDVALMASNAKAKSANSTTIPRERLAQLTIGALQIADIAVKFSSHGLTVAVPFAAITERLRKQVFSRQVVGPAPFGPQQALAHLLKTAYQHSDAFDGDPQWKIQSPQRGQQPGGNP